MSITFDLDNMRDTRSRMREAAIENPILNSPYEEPTRHFRSDDDGVTDEIAEGRRPSSYFVPISATKNRGWAAPAQCRVDAGPDRGQ